MMEKIKIIICCMFIGYIIFTMDFVVKASEITYEEAQEQIEEIVNNMSSDDEFKIVNYDMDELICFDETGFIINEYRESKDFEKLLVEGDIKIYLLPFTNSYNQNAYARFSQQDGVITWVESALTENNSYKMKVLDGRFEGISLSNIDKVNYCYNAIYEFMFDYVKLKNGKEYIIPFLSDNLSSMNSLKYGKVYKIEDFFDIMYRYYNEPTIEELSQGIVGYDEFGGGFLRDKPLQSSTQSNKINMIYLCIGVVAVIGFVIICVRSIGSRKDGKRQLQSVR